MKAAVERDGRRRRSGRRSGVSARARALAAAGRGGKETGPGPACDRRASHHLAALEETRSVGVRLERFPEYGVTLEVFSGVLTPELLLDRLGALRAGDAARWIIYADPTADLSRVDVAAIPEIRRASFARLRELGVADARIAFVCEPGANAPLFDFWLRYVTQYGEHPGQAVFRTLKAACDWLDLPEAACRTLTQAAQAGAAGAGVHIEADPGREPPERRP